MEIPAASSTRIFANRCAAGRQLAERLGEYRGHAAVELARVEGAKQIVVAAPVGTADGVERVRVRADAVITVGEIPITRPLASCYTDFEPVRAVELRRLLKLAQLERDADFHYAHA